MSRVKRNLAASLYFSVANQGAQFIQIACFLRFWGASRYGIWLVLNSIPACLSLSDIGISTALANQLTLVYQNGRIAEAGRLFCSAWYRQLQVALGLAVLVIAASCFLPLEHYLRLDLNHWTFFVTAAAMSVWSVLSVQASMLSALYRAIGAYDKFIALTAHCRILDLFSICTLLWLRSGFEAVAVALVASKILLLVLCWYQLRSVLASFHLSLEQASWRVFRELLPSGLSFLSFTLGNALINQGTTLIANGLAGPVIVTTITVCRQFARLYLNGVSIAFTALQPEIAYLYGARLIDQGLRLHRHALRFVLSTAPIFCVVGALVGPWCIWFWAHHSIRPSHLLVLFFSLEASLVALGNIASMTAWSLNRIVGLAVVYIAGNCLALAATYSCLKLSILSVPLAFSAAAATYAVAAALVSARSIGIRLFQLIQNSSDGQAPRLAGGELSPP